MGYIIKSLSMLEQFVVLKEEISRIQISFYNIRTPRIYNIALITYNGIKLLRPDGMGKRICIYGSAGQMVELSTYILNYH